MVGSRCSSKRGEGAFSKHTANPTDGHQDRLRSTREHDDFVRLHEAARHTAHCFETLGVSIETIDALQQEVLEMSSVDNQQDKSAVRASKQIHRHIASQLRMMRNLLARSQSNRDRLQNEIALVNFKSPMWGPQH